MSETSRPTNSLSPDDALPPVEPPSAGFLVQLFVIPGLIVAIIVAVWLLFHWLAHMGNDPRQYISKLRGNAETRWQAAANLAGSMQGEAGNEIKSDPKVALDLAAILNDAIDEGAMDERPIKMRSFLSFALGEFRVDEPMPVLVRALTTQRHEDEIEVRRAAVRAIAVLASNLKDDSLAGKFPELVPALVAASKSDDDDFRAEAAFTLGVIDDPAANDRLRQMLDDEHVDARFNAAGAFARRGDAAALPVIVEMLDPEQSLSLKSEKQAAHKLKRIIVNVNGLRGLEHLHAANHDLDYSEALKAVDVLTQSETPEIRDKAMSTIRLLQAESPASATH